LLKKIPTAELRLGMYLHAFDGPWLHHPFWRKRPVELPTLLGLAQTLKTASSSDQPALRPLRDKHIVLLCEAHDNAQATAFESAEGALGWHGAERHQRNGHALRRCW